MLNELTFKEVCKFLKKDDGSLIEAVDKLSGAAILLSPLAPGSQVVSAVVLLGIKNELTKIGKYLVEKVTGKGESDYLARMERMQIAYGLICITAFFEALDQLMPDELRSKIALLPQEKTYLIEEAGKRSVKPEGRLNTSKILKEGVQDIPLPFPHPVLPFEQQQESLGQMYKEMSICFDSFIKKLAVWEDADDSVAACIQHTINELPKKSLQCFEGQYLELARKYTDFCVWSQFNERQAIQKQIGDITNYLDSYNSSLAENNNNIDIGFDKLQETVLSIPEQFREVEARDVVDGLQRYYEARINEPIIEDDFPSDDGSPSLNFPKISQAFIPQSYRVILKTKKESHLEREETWRNVKVNHDLGAFLLRYLSSPYSIETPLLILGHPGIGKSLLTKVLCARFMSKALTLVRVPLREVNADLPIEEQVELIIYKTTGQKLSSLANFSSQFSDKPLVIILDGYDELLQASGKVYGGFLRKIQQFQKREIEQRRPVRVIVTSRITLIDKTSIPEGSTVLRLLEFNETQRNTWIQVWNNANEEYFSSCNPPIEPFSIPTDKNKWKSDKILSLAEQPLLLLMLAIYDSAGNRLRQHQGIDRTVLYNSLLRRFVERERRRYIDDFDGLDRVTQEKEIDREMLRLGAVAIGMYNRKQLHVLSSELSADLNFFKLGREIAISDGRPMNQADLLLGSFFFIHKSKAGQQEEEGVSTSKDTAFEFLHNTFGEFLTAVFILNFAFQEAEVIHTLKQNESLQPVLHQKINTPDGLAKEWFACLMYAPLYSRPVVLEMLREWTGHLLQHKGLSREAFLNSLDEILKSQIGMILKETNLPSMLKNDGENFAVLPLLGHISIYTLNLIVLRTILDKKGFVFDESDYDSKENNGDSNASETRAWDKLTHIWRSWFFLDSLSGLSAILSAQRKHSKIRLTSNKSFQVRSSRDRLETVLNVATTLTDNVLGGLTSLLIPNSDEGSWQYLAEVEAKLEGESIDLEFEFIVRRLRIYLYSRDVSKEELYKLVQHGLREVLSRKQRRGLVSEFFNLITRFHPYPFHHHIRRKDWLIPPRHFQEIVEMRPDVAIEWLYFLRNISPIYLPQGYCEELFQHVVRPRYFRAMLEARPEVAIELLSLTRELGGASVTHWLERSGGELFEHIFESRYFGEMLEARPEVTIEILSLAKEIGGATATHWLERSGGELFEHIFESRYFGEMLEARPEVTIEILSLAREIGGASVTHWLEHRSVRLFEHFLNTRQFTKMMKRQSMIAIEFLHLTRTLDENRWLEHFAPEFLEVFKQVISSNLSKVPLGYVQDVKWYAENTSNTELITNLQKYIGIGVDQE